MSNLGKVYDQIVFLEDVLGFKFNGVDFHNNQIYYVLVDPNGKLGGYSEKRLSEIYDYFMNSKVVVF